MSALARALATPREALTRIEWFLPEDDFGVENECSSADEVAACWLSLFSAVHASPNLRLHVQGYACLLRDPLFQSVNPTPEFQAWESLFLKAQAADAMIAQVLASDPQLRSRVVFDRRLTAGRLSDLIVDRAYAREDGYILEW